MDISVECNLERAQLDAQCEFDWPLCRCVK